MRLVYCLCAAVFFALLFTAQSFALTIIECPATQLELSKVDFNAGSCKESTLQNYSMSAKSVWLSMYFPASDDLLSSDQPIGIFISGRMSARVFVNDTKIGENGVSSLTPDAEVAGAFDWVGYVPRTALNRESNQLFLHISSFQSQQAIVYPFNWFYTDRYQAATNNYQLHYMPTLIPLGVMILSLIYLIRRMLLEPRSLQLAYLLILTLAAMSQLVTEISRGFYAYSYPVHSLRLTAIWFLAFIFGQALLALCLDQFTKMKKRYPIAICLGLILLLPVMYLDPDLRAAYSILIPAILAAGCIALEYYRKNTRQLAPSIILFAFASLIIITPSNFLDVYLYYCIAALLAYLFSYEAQNKVRQQNRLVHEKQRAEKIQLALDMVIQDNATQTIPLKDAGKINLLPIENILFCQGAGDYVEVIMADKTILHSGSLSRLITELPSYFIKVHRSYLVNAKHIVHMRRLPAGTGEIELTNGHVIPVSRRLLPKLKETLVGD